MAQDNDSATTWSKFAPHLWDAGVTAAAGTVGALAGWAIWLVVSAPCLLDWPEMSPECVAWWDKNAVSLSALAVVFPCYIVTSNLGRWLYDAMLRRDNEKARAEDRAFAQEQTEKIVQAITEGQKAIIERQESIAAHLAKQAEEQKRVAERHQQLADAIAALPGQVADAIRQSRAD